MNIFNRNKSLDDDLPGRQAMPRPTLPPVEEQVGDMVRDQFSKRRPEPRTPAVLAAELETNGVAFELAVNDAESAAHAYCQTYAELTEEISAKLEAIEAQRKELRRLQASLPKVEKPDVQDETNSNIVDASTGERVLIDAQPSPSKNPVPIKPIEGLSKPLPLNRR